MANDFQYCGFLLMIRTGLAGMIFGVAENPR